LNTQFVFELLPAVLGVELVHETVAVFKLAVGEGQSLLFAFVFCWLCSICDCARYFAVELVQSYQFVIISIFEVGKVLKVSIFTKPENVEFLMHTIICCIGVLTIDLEFIGILLIDCLFFDFFNLFWRVIFLESLLFSIVFFTFNWQFSVMGCLPIVLFFKSVVVFFVETFDLLNLVCFRINRFVSGVLGILGVFCLW